MRSHTREFRNNRNYLDAKLWEEFKDGTYLSKQVVDDGCGKKTVVESGMKLNLS